VAFVGGSVQLWDLAQQQMTFGTTGFSPAIGGLTYTHDGKYLLIRHPGTVEIRRRSDGAVWANYDAVAAALSPVNNTLALGNAEGRITLLDVNTGQVIHEIVAHKDTLFALAFSPDGQLLASSSQDCTIRLWEVATGNFLHLFEETIVNAYGEPNFASRIFIRSLHFIPGANTLMGFGSWGTVVSWNVNSGATRFVIESAPLEYYNGMMTLDPHFPEALGVDVDNNRFYINDQAYNLKTGEALGKAERPTTLPRDCAAGGTLSADGSLLFTAGYDSNDGQVCVLNAADHQLIQVLDVIPEAGRDYAGLSALTLSPDGTQLALSTWGGMVYVYQAVP
jgi:WD40 repeat protein